MLQVKAKELPVSEAGSKQLVLVVDDDAVNRMILTGMLEEGGFNVVTAEDGQQSIKTYVEKQPDIILMDVMMPVLDGYQAAEQIKELAGDHFVPIIFLTAVTNENELAKCVKVGGDDFLTKPYSKTILMAKIEAFTRMTAMYATITTQRDAIDEHNEHMLREQKVAKRIFSRIVREGCLDIPNLRYMLSPMSVFNGDLLLAAFTPSGGLNIMLGDATGHGLPAAIGAVPVSDLFYSLTSAGATLDEIVLEMNQKLRAILPPEFFFCATVLNISNDFKFMTLWHGGLPDILVYGAEEKKLKYKIRSTNFPLGVVDNKMLDTTLQVFDLSKGDRIYLYSDGITEARNINNELFGGERLEKCFKQSVEADVLFDKILSEIHKFTDTMAQSDDLTLIEINADVDLNAGLDKDKYDIASTVLPFPKNWSLSMSLGIADFVNTNPVSVVTKLLVNIEELVPHKENLFTILSELYNNALDHGILLLESSLKEQADGFSKYLLERKKRMDNLSEGEILVNLNHQVTNTGGELMIRIEDSGNGFDHKGFKEDMDSNFSFFGRGVALIESLCSEFRYIGKGNVAMAIYSWTEVE